MNEELWKQESGVTHCCSTIWQLLAKAGRKKTEASTHGFKQHFKSSIFSHLLGLND